jgi:hypothetical protein
MKPDSSEARERAKRILSERRFKKRNVPRPFKRQLDWIGDRVSRFFSAIGRFLSNVVPGGSTVVWALLIGLLIALMIFLLRNNLRKAFQRKAVETSDPIEAANDADALEREAEQASQRGDSAEAIRLRFLAGLTRFERARLVATPSRKTNRDVAGQIREKRTAHGAPGTSGSVIAVAAPTSTQRGSTQGATTEGTNVAVADTTTEIVERFGPLATSFDAIHYGGKPATPQDDDESRREWEQVRNAVRNGAGGKKRGRS